MEGRGSAVLGLGQLPTPFGQRPLQEEGAPLPRRWRSGSPEPDARSPGDAAAAAEEQDEAEEEEEEERAEALLALRRRHGRSLSLPASPKLAAARLFAGDGASGGGGGGCCAGCSKKRVQFADALGLCLASVKHFSAAEEPQVPPAALSRLHSFPARPQDLPLFGAATAALRDLLPLGAPAPPITTQARPLALRLPAGGERLDGARLRTTRVCLEEASGTALGGAPADVRGVVRVLACAGAKEVTVRYTFNEWLSFLDSPAAPLGPDPSDDAVPDASAAVERYRFALCLPPGLPEGTAVHFAVCYRSQQGEFWDNNGGGNYTLRACPP